MITSWSHEHTFSVFLHERSLKLVKKWPRAPPCSIWGLQPLHPAQFWLLFCALVTRLDNRGIGYGFDNWMTMNYLPLIWRNATVQLKTWVTHSGFRRAHGGIDCKVTAGRATLGYAYQMYLSTVVYSSADSTSTSKPLRIVERSEDASHSVRSHKHCETCWYVDLLTTCGLGTLIPLITLLYAIGCLRCWSRTFSFVSWFPMKFLPQKNDQFLQTACRGQSTNGISTNGISFTWHALLQKNTSSQPPHFLSFSLINSAPCSKSITRCDGLWTLCILRQTGEAQLLYICWIRISSWA